MYLVLYLTPKQDLKIHLLKSVLFREVGDINNFGWKIISIQIFYKGKFTDYFKYLDKISQPKKRFFRKKQQSIFYIDKKSYEWWR